MAEMVDKLAKQFAVREGWTWDNLHEEEDTSFGWSRVHIRTRVYQSIVGMLEPNEAMIEAGGLTLLGNYPMAEAVWRAMCATALAS